MDTGVRKFNRKKKSFSSTFRSSPSSCFMRSACSAPYGYIECADDDCFPSIQGNEFRITAESHAMCQMRVTKVVKIGEKQVSDRDAFTLRQFPGSEMVYFPINWPLLVDQPNISVSVVIMQRNRKGRRKIEWAKTSDAAASSSTFLSLSLHEADLAWQTKPPEICVYKQASFP